jgi:hypothetical protein
MVENAKKAGVIKNIKLVITAVLSSNSSFEIKNMRKIHSELVIMVNIFPTMKEIPKILKSRARV